LKHITPITLQGLYIIETDHPNHSPGVYILLKQIGGTVAAWVIAHLGSCHLGKNLSESTYDQIGLATKFEVNFWIKVFR